VTDKIVVLSSCESEQEAKSLAHHLVEKRLAACVNILPAALSVYRWKGGIEEAPEFLLVIKSRRDVFPALKAELELRHSYETPEIIALPVVDGSGPYLNWLDGEL
jgi:periplasmic divalent cation tolerance protein